MHRMKELRKKAGMSQAELAEILGIQPPAVSKYETGRTELSEKHIKTLCSVFHTGADYLLGLSDIRDITSHDGVILKEAELYGSSKDIIKNIDRALSSADKTLKLLESQQWDVFEQLNAYKQKIEEMICKLFALGVSEKIISEATGISISNIKLIIAGNKSLFKSRL